ncbi:MAG TPA: HD domain-containing protein [Methylomirabilota bacterium]|jgi:putative nucleotidyltransferase with HDIG domain|nr:HD domain-containing protein [Methylomirabilota bacterium]
MAELRLERLAPSHIGLLGAVAATSGRRVTPALVGGAVRDAWLGRPLSRDLDVAVPAGAVDLARRVAGRLAGAFVLLDAERGAARVLALGYQLDLTDFRASTLEGDLAARDYTVNALAVPLGELLRRGRAPIVDPTGGLADLRARRLRPASRGALADDPLRALRSVRLELALGLRLTPGAARAVVAVAPALAGVSAERIRDELIALLALPETARALRRADRLGLLPVVLPEVEPMRSTPQPAPHRFSVLEHSLRAVAAADLVVAGSERLEPFGDELAPHLREPLGGGIERAHTLKLAALLHDVSKPQTRRTIDGHVRFFEHDVLGAVRVRAIGERLRLPEAVTTVLARLVRHHLRPMHLAGAGAVTNRARYRFYRDLGPETRDLLLLALVDAAAVRGESPLRVWRRATLIRELLGGWEVQRRAVAAPPLVRGGDVMERFGLGPGPEVGRLLARAREAQDLGLVRTREEALAYLDSCGGHS